ncbi:right-handed parallel beta-helix repeat-containing protein [Pseudonocardia sp.]|uniref:right-handed parallel beta-helix repeat-containing protein n=1 Tax=Pseudonocardia sp. TaxID=60912 RepID=UPI0026105798|nr:right-handed parallel beta-helix repeat-containing protein [Pseudonocardia sp.]
MSTSTELRRGAPVVALVVLCLLLAGCVGSVPAPGPTTGGAEGAPDPVPPVAGIGAVCDNTEPGPATSPEGAVVVDPAVDRDLFDKTRANPPGTTFWLMPGTHTLGTDEFGQVIPKDGNTYLGAPGAIVDGRELNRFAFIGKAENVAIRHLTVRGFVPPTDQGVVNHDSGNGWVIEHNTVEENRGAGLRAGAGQQVRGNCLRNNGQYGMNAYQPENGIVDLVVEGNEIVGNNTDDWEAQIPGCGCTGGIKFWSVDGADVRGNWVHDNRGPGLWADTNNNDFLIEGNLIEDNDGEAVFYETSYNLVLRDNVVRNNTVVAGRVFSDRGNGFPVGTVYLSEAGGEPRVPARTDRVEIYGNVFENNWSGITVWENADRFCGSAANTSTGSCTRLVPDVDECAQPEIASEPLYSDCRWKSQRIDIHDNEFAFSPAVVGCAPGFAGRMAVLSNYGTFPDWSPYMGEVVQEAITLEQDVRWRANTYTGPWTFVMGDVGTSSQIDGWQAEPYLQDVDSTFGADAAEPSCETAQ